MEIRMLGQTGLEVSPIGLGLAALGRPGYINLGHQEDLEADYVVAHMEQRTHAVLHAAWEAGIRYFDAARSYGKAEDFLGSWLHQKQPAPQALTVGSKWGYYYTADWQVQAEAHEIKDHQLSLLDQQWAESQERLGNFLDLYQIHSATLDSGVLDRKEVLERLAELKAQGTRIGLSLSGPQQGQTLEKALQVQVDGIPLFDTVQASWNLLEPSAGPALQAANEAGWGIIIKEALANGRLTDRNRQYDQESLTVLRQVAREMGTTTDALALAFVLHQPWVHVALSGAATVAHLQSNLTALDLQLSDGQLSELGNLAMPAAAYWQVRKSLSWN
ncbi:MAG: aldo/keto reductase [Bacteroidota bacterium]